MNADLFMSWFDLVFPPLMLVSLPVFCFCVPSRSESAEKALEAKRWMIRMWLLAVASLAVYFVAYRFGGPQWRQLWVLCFFQIPVMNKLLFAKNPSYSTPYAGATRAAALTRREMKSTVPRVAWISVWVLWAVLGAVAAWGYSRHELPLRLGYMIAMFVVGPAFFLALGPLLVKTTANEPEPLDPGDSPELSAAYDKHRRARSWMFFSLPVTTVILFGGCAAAMAWLATSPEVEGQIGLYGGMAGAVVGLAGGVAGTFFGVWRAKLNQQVRDLTLAQQTSDS